MKRSFALRRSFFSFAVVLALLFSMTASFALAEEGNADAAVQRQVLTTELAAVLETASAEELIPVTVWLDGIDVDEVEAEVLKEVGLNKAMIWEMAANGTDGELTSEEVDAYIEAERRIYAEKQKEATEAFLTYGEASMDQGLQGLTADGREIFVSQYAPMFATELTKAEIRTLAASEQVEEIYYTPEQEIAAVDEPVAYETDAASATGVTLSSCYAKIRADYVRDTLGYTGDGVKIGQIESATKDFDTTYFTNSKIHFDTAVTTAVLGMWQGSEEGRAYMAHANSVAYIMVGNEGLAPDADLYCTYASTAVEYYIKIEWLLTQGVNVINMSAGFSKSAGTYTYIDKWFDHLAINHSVHFVKSAGNSGAEVTNPGMAYNVITVGATNYTFTARAQFSSYVDGDSYANKPDLLAPGEYIILPFYSSADSGTSYAAPMVTAIVAQILEARPSLKTQQDAMKAILTSSIHDSTLRYTPASSAFDKCGAGLVDARSAMNTARLGQYTSNAYFSAGASAGTVKTYTFTVSDSDDLIRVSLTWLKNNQISSTSHTDGSVTEGTVADLNLQVLNPSGTVVAESAKSSGNLEIVQFTPTVTGTYTVRVTLAGSSDKKTYFSASWW